MQSPLSFLLMFSHCSPLAWGCQCSEHWPTEPVAHPLGTTWLLLFQVMFLRGCIPPVLWAGQQGAPQGAATWGELLAGCNDRYSSEPSGSIWLLPALLHHDQGLFSPVGCSLPLVRVMEGMLTQQLKRLTRPCEKC